MKQKIDGVQCQLWSPLDSTSECLSVTVFSTHTKLHDRPFSCCAKRNSNICVVIIVAVITMVIIITITNIIKSHHHHHHHHHHHRPRPRRGCRHRHNNFDGLVQARRNSIALAMELRNFRTNMLIWFHRCAYSRIKQSQDISSSVYTQCSVYEFHFCLNLVAKFTLRKYQWAIFWHPWFYNLAGFTREYLCPFLFIHINKSSGRILQ